MCVCREEKPTQIQTFPPHDSTSAHVCAAVIAKE